ncbi:MAG TPA: metallophosphoesterase [Terriglobales bacterium]|nr:metallophosphoesterase [Terriglobales bacterium]
MEHAGTSLLRSGFSRQALDRWFFHNFFFLLFLCVTASQWVLLWWVWLHQWVDSVMLHAAGMAIFYGFNRYLVLGRAFGRGARPRNFLPRLYYGFAFASLFCSVYLLLVGIAWAAAGTLVEVNAGTSVGQGFIWIANAGVAAIGSVFVYGYTIGQRRLIVRKFTIPVPDLPAALEGFRIAQLSDIHVGPNMARLELANFVSRANETKPDLICITGDIADTIESDLADGFPILAQLKATHGVIAILGNHDHYCGATRVVEALRRHTPFQVLRDEITSITVGAAVLQVIGLDDRGVNWARGVSATPVLTDLLQQLPGGGPVLLLCHRPDIFAQAAELGIPLTLSGHTHGGQLGIPVGKGKVLNPSRIITPFDRGLFERNGCLLYVNCGLGVTGQRLRISTPREISVFELRRAEPVA